MDATEATPRPSLLDNPMQQTEMLIARIRREAAALDAELSEFAHDPIRGLTSQTASRLVNMINELPETIERDREWLHLYMKIVGSFHLIRATGGTVDVYALALHNNTSVEIVERVLASLERYASGG